MSYPPPGQSPYPPGPPPGGGYGGPPKHLRGRIPLRLSVIFLVVGIALVVVGGVVVANNSLGKVDSFSRVSVASGSGTATFTGTGGYLAYYEAPGVGSSTDRVPLPLITLRSPSGKTMTLETLYGGHARSDGRINSRLTYNYNGHNGVAIYQFTINEKGTYQVQLQAPGNTDPRSDIAFGTSIAGGLAIGVALIIPGILLFVAGIVLLIVGLVKRSRHKGQLASYGAGYGGGYGGYSGGPPPPNYGYPPQG